MPETATKRIFVMARTGAEAEDGSDIVVDLDFEATGWSVDENGALNIYGPFVNHGCVRSNDRVATFPHGEWVRVFQAGRDTRDVEIEDLRRDNEDLRKRNLDRSEEVERLTAENARLRQVDGFTVSAMRMGHSLELRAARREAEREASAAFERGVVAGRDALRQTIRTVLRDPYRAVASPPWSSGVFEGDRFVAWFGGIYENGLVTWELNKLRHRVLHAIDPHGEDA